MRGPVRAGLGLLGQRWRIRRSWLSAVLAVSPLLLEWLTGVLRPGFGGAASYATEIGAGLAAAGYFATAPARARHRPAQV